VAVPGRTQVLGGLHAHRLHRFRSCVERFHAAALAAGARDNGKPRVRADNGPNYYAAFLLDPDGNNVESLWLR